MSVPRSRGLSDFRIILEVNQVVIVALLFCCSNLSPLESVYSPGKNALLGLPNECYRQDVSSPSSATQLISLKGINKQQPPVGYVTFCILSTPGESDENRSMFSIVSLSLLL